MIIKNICRIKSCLSCKTSALSYITPNLKLTMRFTEMLLFAACALFPTLLVTGSPTDLERLQPTVLQDAEQGNAIRDLLVSRQYYCPTNKYICETKYCCTKGWGCCSSLSFFISLTWLSAYLYIPDGGCCSPGWVPLSFQSSISLFSILNRTYCVITPDKEIGCCPNGKLCYGNPKWGQQFPMAEATANREFVYTLSILQRTEILEDVIITPGSFFFWCSPCIYAWWIFCLFVCNNFKLTN